MPLGFSFRSLCIIYIYTVYTVRSVLDCDVVCRQLRLNEDKECGAEEQTVDHAVLQCPIYRPPHGLHGLTVLDDETTDWVLNTCPEI